MFHFGNSGPMNPLFARMFELVSPGPLTFSNGGNEVMLGSHLSNKLTGGAGNDSLAGLEGNDTLKGGAGNDTLVGGEGNDVLDGGSGSDTASYAETANGVTVSLALQGAQNTIGAATDTLTGIENLTGTPGNDRLTGDGKANVITGLAGNDLLAGGAGNDTLIGSHGNDTLSGNAGADSFVFEGHFGKDTIGDFTAAGAGHDIISFSTAVFANYAAVQGHMAQVGPNVVITHDAADTVTLKGVTLASLTAADFNFHGAPNHPTSAPAEHSWADHSAHFNNAFHLG